VRRLDRDQLTNWHASNLASATTEDEVRTEASRVSTVRSLAFRADEWPTFDDRNSLPERRIHRVVDDLDGRTWHVVRT